MTPQTTQTNDEGPRPGVHPGIRRLIERPGGLTHKRRPKKRKDSHKKETRPRLGFKRD